ncbi:hemicentin-2 isoform X1 [Nematostella vectensis]|uniref:hemicentin-2 isoform X1 n=1 Tax=Nematostella vectensis TaxID=45351 RepID=UPI0020779943|nr:hemicentin-2 isoform X1 [Nematostella vectensis]
MGSNGLIILSMLLQTSVLIAASFENKTVREGDDVTIKCKTLQSSFSSSYTWTKDGVPRSTKERELNITAVKRTDAGVYKCFEGNLERGATQLTVEYQPSFDHKTIEIAVYDLQIVQLPCEVDSFPHANFTWRKNGYLLSVSKRLVVLPASSCNRNTSTLMVAMTGDEENSVYSCVAQNPHGMDTKTFRIATNYKAKSGGWGSPDVAGLIVGLMLSVLLIFFVTFFIVRGHRRLEDSKATKNPHTRLDENGLTADGAQTDSPAHFQTTGFRTLPGQSHKVRSPERKVLVMGDDVGAVYPIKASGEIEDSDCAERILNLSQLPEYRHTSLV